MKDFERIAWLREYMEGADHIDVKEGRGPVSLRAVAAGILSYEPQWMRHLWKVRFHLLKWLGQGESVIPARQGYTAETLPVEPGEAAAFFTVAASDGETYWVAFGEESHLGAALGVVAEVAEDDSGVRRFKVITVVRYRNWAGPIYFNLIRPFHHLVVVMAMKSVLAGAVRDGKRQK